MPGESSKRLRQRHAEVLPVVQQPELRAHGSGNLIGDHGEARREGVSRSKRRARSARWPRGILLELEQPPAAPPAKVDRAHREDQASEGREGAEGHEQGDDQIPRRGRPFRS